jgi:hypothetical protein
MSRPISKGNLMRKLRLLLLLVTLVLATLFTANRPVKAGNIPVGVWCYSQECTEQNPAPQNFFWQQENAEAWQMYCSSCG